MKSKHNLYQGRSSKQTEDSFKLASVGLIGCTVIVVLLIFNSIIR